MYRNNYAVVKKLMPVVFGLSAYFGGTFSPFQLSNFTRIIQENVK